MLEQMMQIVSRAIISKGAILLIFTDGVIKDVEQTSFVSPRRL